MKVGDTTIQLWNIDCVDGMRQFILPSSVDIAITAPPLLPDERDLDEYLGWTEQWVGALCDVLGRVRKAGEI